MRARGGPAGTAEMLARCASPASTSSCASPVSMRGRGRRGRWCSPGPRKTFSSGCQKTYSVSRAGPRALCGAAAGAAVWGVPCALLHTRCCTRAAAHALLHTRNPPTRKPLIGRCGRPTCSARSRASRQRPRSSLRAPPPHSPAARAHGGGSTGQYRNCAQSASAPWAAGDLPAPSASRRLSGPRSPARARTPSTAAASSAASASNVSFAAKETKSQLVNFRSSGRSGAGPRALSCAHVRPRRGLRPPRA